MLEDKTWLLTSFLIHLSMVYGPHFLHRGFIMLKQERDLSQAGATINCSIILTLNSYPNPEKQSQTINHSFTLVLCIPVGREFISSALYVVPDATWQFAQ